MNKTLKQLTRWDSGRVDSLVPFFAILFKFLLFDAIWCYYTTFQPFSKWPLYVTSVSAAMLVALPYILSRRRWVGVTMMVLTDIWLVANLMYFRTYFSAIPPSSYFLAGNLADFMPAVAGSLNVCDALFPLSTAGAIIMMFKLRKTRGAVVLSFSRLVYVVVLAVLVGGFALAMLPKGGFIKVYDRQRSHAYLHSSMTPMYSLFGTLYYNIRLDNARLTDVQQAQVAGWFAEMDSYLSDNERIQPPVTVPKTNCVIIFAESLESWVIGLDFEGKEITPNLNRLVADSTTIYAPHVLTQVNAGRSIDAQLLILAGLMPLRSGVYSTLYPDNTYYTLPKASKEINHTRNYLITVDKTKTWNQRGVARAFGIDTILSYPDFEQTEAFGTRKTLGDRAFFRQCIDKIERGEIWPVGEKAFVQMVTYSGHFPFRLPEELKTIAFSDTIPEMMRDYMTDAHYTDAAIGSFIDYLRTRPDYDSTLVVITGDHEGLANNRRELCASKGGGVISKDEFTPLIILNAPASMTYDGVMGQIDIYPTILELLGLRDYKWHGLGQSILDPSKPAVAVSPRMVVKGDTAGITADRLEHLRQAPEISDLVIRFNLLEKR
jgi:hypothetical protein